MQYPVDIFYLIDQHRRHREVLQRLRLEKKLEVHQGCVNTVAWNRLILLSVKLIVMKYHAADDCFKRSGTLLLSGSDDHRLVITDPFNYRLSSKSVNYVGQRNYCVAG